MSLSMLAAVAGGVFLLTLVSLSALLRSGLAWRLAVDTPNERSLHSQVTPRVGGLGFMPWAIAAGLLFGDGRTIFAAALALAILSYADDRIGLPIGVRFGAHLVFAGAAVVTLLPGAHGLWLLPVLVLAVAWMTNLYNFMDGADGLAGGMAVIGFAAYAIAAAAAGALSLSMSAAAVAAGAGAFLCFNFPPARVFMGDAGSVPLGFLAATLGLQGWVAGVWPAWFPGMVFLPFIADASVTLLRRALAGERFWLAHRDHAYQKLVRSGWAHRRLAFSAYALMLAVAASGLWLRTQPSGIVAAAWLFWALFFALIFGAVERYWRRRG